MSSFTDHLSGFTGHMKVKNYSPSSIFAYCQHLPGLFAHLKEQGIEDVKRVTRDHLQSYQLMITEHTSTRTKGKYSAGTICTKTRAMKRFFKYLEDSGVILINPAEHIKEPKMETRLPRNILTEEEIKKILAQPRINTISGLRARGAARGPLLNRHPSRRAYESHYLRLRSPGRLDPGQGQVQ